MNNYKLTIQYDGSEFCGWQIQKKSNSIQQEISNALKILLKEEINLLGAGRTDAGVHALGQVANFRTDNILDLRKFSFSLNALLPKSISIRKMEIVGENFHSRFDAVKRSYIYLVSGIKSPFYYKYSYFSPGIFQLDTNQLNLLSSTLKGEHDFSSFCKKNEKLSHYNCFIHDLRFRKRGDFLIFYIEANRFLHGMVRTILGTVINSLSPNTKLDSMEKILNSKDRSKAGPSVPSIGLFLHKVRYNND